MAISFPQILVILVLLAVYVYPWSLIFRKAGFTPWLSLLMIVPIANFVVFLVLAFRRWPALERPTLSVREP